jgi:signal transduction histidine kinase
MAAHEDERRRLARELHDHLNLQLAVLAIELQQLAISPPSSAAPLSAALQDLWRQTTEISSQVQAISNRLHPSKLEVLGLATAARGHCRDISRKGIMVHFSDRSGPGEVPPDVALCLFRVLEEAVSNALRHSGAAEVFVMLQGIDQHLMLRVSDSGCGFDPADQRQATGLGLMSMHERLRSVRGTLRVASTPGVGTIIEARVARTVTRGAGSASPLVDAARTTPAGKSVG